MCGGSYVLVVRRTRGASLEVGALGTARFPPGGYAYVGSAQSGFGRLERHRAVAAGENPTRHWHIDYLLGAPGTSLVETIRIPDRDVECTLASTFDDSHMSGFGASDCGCDAHLFHTEDVETIQERAREARRQMLRS
ncbi:MAG: DUF123 domain-containing protein [Halobacteriaceae archaeon]